MQQSGEMYLETILLLTRQRSMIRSIDIAAHTGYSKPSVSRAVNLLQREGYIEIDHQGYITLREQGLKIAENIYNRHVVFTELLTILGVSPETAQRDACKIEHDISDETFLRVSEYVDSIRLKSGGLSETLL